ncbi:MAG: hypothetical protein FWF25_01380 [Propionibacteriaceae bacterium]|nr:hypothetical protein [Propionibacteriaceae bacterium]
MAYQDDPNDIEKGIRARYVPEHITDEAYGAQDQFSQCATAVAAATKAAQARGIKVDAAAYYVATEGGNSEEWPTFEDDIITASKLVTTNSPPAGGEVIVAPYLRGAGTQVVGHTRSYPRHT